MDTTPAHKTQKRPMVPIQTCFRAFMVSPLVNDSDVLVTVCLFFDQGPGALTFYTVVGRGFPGFLSVSFANQIPVPIRNFDDEVSCAVRYALAAKTAVRSKTGRERQLFVFSLAHLGDGFEALTNNAMARRASTHA